MKKIVIIGAGGYAKVIAETIELSDQLQVAGFVDDHIERGVSVYEEQKVLGSINDIPEISGQCDGFVIGIGNNEVRKQIADRFSGKILFETLVHQNAFVSKTAVLAEGVVVLAGAIVNSNAEIGKHSIINSNVIVDHDCRIGEFVHLAIGTLVGSNSEIRSLVKTQIGQAVPSFSVI